MKNLEMNLQRFAGRAAGELIERKYLAHYVDAAFDKTGEATDYVRLGKDLEDYNVELNPDVETTKNIWGEARTKVKGYEPEGDVETFYAYEGEALYEKLFDIVNKRSTGSELETTVVDVLINSDGTIVTAYRESAVVVPQSIGGDTAGMQIPFNVYYNGDRVEGTWNATTKKFTVSAAG